ncbi:DUF3021 domain-containing protein [Pediococcus siamensis]|uniref:DUF3021 domain-containing protein n=1 Tax=Pediococcus siamensis TaxID=381829 RepID=UPI0039A10DC9
MFKKVGRNIINGIGFGSFAYLMVLLFKIQTTIPTTRNILSILIMSVGIGLISLIFENETLVFLAQLALHLIGTLILVVVMMFYNSWVLGSSFWIIFILLYVVFWTISGIQRYMQVEKMNTAISRRRKNMK